MNCDSRPTLVHPGYSIRPPVLSCQTKPSVLRQSWHHLHPPHRGLQHLRSLFWRYRDTYDKDCSILGIDVFVEVPNKLHQSLLSALWVGFGCPGPHGRASEFSSGLLKSTQLEKPGDQDQARVDRAIKACASRWASLVPGCLRSGVKGQYCNTVILWELLVSVSFRLGTHVLCYAGTFPACSESTSRRL